MATTPEKSNLSPTSGLITPRKRQVGRCPMCASVGYRFLFNATDRLFGVPGEFTYVRCTSCRTIYQDPMIVQDDLKLCYPIEYYSISSGGAPDDQPVVAPASKRRLARTRDVIRQAIVDSVQDAPNGTLPLLGRLLAMSAYLRKRAFWLIPDQLIP